MQKVKKMLQIKPEKKTCKKLLKVKTKEIGHHVHEQCPMLLGFWFQSKYTSNKQ